MKTTKLNPKPRAKRTAGSQQRVVSLPSKIKAQLFIWHLLETEKIEAIKRQDFEEAHEKIKRRNEYANVICKRLHQQANNRI